MENVAGQRMFLEELYNYVSIIIWNTLNYEILFFLHEPVNLMVIESALSIIIKFLNVLGGCIILQAGFLLLEWKKISSYDEMTDNPFNPPSLSLRTLTLELSGNVRTRSLLEFLGVLLRKQGFRVLP